MPLISIAMTTYNGDKYLKEQLDSIYSQTHKNIEIIVSDDCSTDGTVEILDKYSKSHGLKYHRNNNNLGFVKNFEYAISLCKGEYIALSDQDDIWVDNKLETLIKKIKSNLLIHSDCKIINENGDITSNTWKKELGYFDDIDNLMFRNVVTGCTVLFNRDLLKTLLPFPDGLAYHDWWLAICASRNNNRICYTTECLTLYRQHSNQDTGAGEEVNFFLKVFFNNIKKRWKGESYHKMIAFVKQKQNLHSLKKTYTYNNIHSEILDDAIIYFDNYTKNQIHFRTFLISLKYRNILYINKNYKILRAVLNDIIG